MVRAPRWAAGTRMLPVPTKGSSTSPPRRTCGQRREMKVWATRGKEVGGSGRRQGRAVEPPWGAPRAQAQRSHLPSTTDFLIPDLHTAPTPLQLPCLPNVGHEESHLCVHAGGPQVAPPRQVVAVQGGAVARAHLAPKVVPAFRRLLRQRDTGRGR
jgi:hypothetical protein